jgi:D-aspartate ligase
MPSSPAVIILDLFYGSLQIGRSLGSKGIKVLGIATSQDSPGIYSRWIERLNAPMEDGALKDYLVSFSQNLEVRPVLVPTSDRFVLFLLKYWETLAESYLFPHNAHAAGNLVGKAASAELFAEKKIRSPRTIKVKKGATSVPPIGSIDFPCVLKPDFHDSWETNPKIRAEIGEGRRALKIADCTMLERMVQFLSPFSDLVIQEFVSGPATNNFYYVGYRSFKGCVTASYVGQKIRTLPDGMGSETLIRTVVDPEIRDQAESLLDRVDYRGPVGMEFKRDERDGVVKLIEVNCRFGLNDASLIRKAIDLPYLYYLDSQKVEVPSQKEYPAGLSWYNFGADLDWMRTYRKENRIGWLRWTMDLLKGYDSYVVFDWRDPGPFFVELWHLLQRIACRPFRRRNRV